MTQSLTALFSPETSPDSADLYPFRLLCDALIFYALPDGGTPVPGQEGAGGAYTPVRLSEEDQARFQSLVLELKGNEAEFHSGLLASLSAGRPDRDEASVGALIAGLRSGPKPDAPKKTVDETLWRAMLILKLAEMFRQEQREIAREFTALSGKEAELFATIRGMEEEEEGDEEEELALRELAAAAAQSGPVLNPLRLAKAWGCLFSRDPRAEEIPLLVTTHEELHGVLADGYEARTGKAPRLLVSLVLPSPALNREDGGPMEEFRAATSEARAQFNRLLLGVAAGGTIDPGVLAALQGSGNDLNRAALPYVQGSTKEMTMRFYAYEGASLCDLFAGPGNLSQPPKAAVWPTGLVAVLS